MPWEPPRTVFRSLARPANAEGLFHRRRGPPKAANASKCTQAEATRNWAGGLAPRVTLRPSAELDRHDAVGIDLPVERLGIDREQRGGLAAMAVHLPQDRDDVLAFHRFEAAAGRGRRRGVRSEDLRWKIGGKDLVSLAQDHGALDGMQQLADVARPRVGFERREGGGGQPLEPVFC